MKSTERLSCQRIFPPVKYVCCLYATTYEGIQTSAVTPAICLTGLHLLHLCMEYWLLYFLRDIKDIRALISHVCVHVHVSVFKVVLLPLLEIDPCYLYKV